MYSYGEMIAAIRSGKIQPGAEIERSYDDDDDDLYWEFDYKSVISFAVGIDTPGTYAMEPYWAMHRRVEDRNLLFAELTTEGDGSDNTRLMTTIGEDDNLTDLVANFVMSDDFKMQFAVPTHYKSENFQNWNYPPAEAVDEFAWCSTTLAKKAIDAISTKLMLESLIYKAFCEFFDSPDDTSWLGFKDGLVRHNNLTKFYDVYKWDKPETLS